jgi:hypothetical protein
MVSLYEAKEDTPTPQYYLLHTNLSGVLSGVLFIIVNAMPPKIGS